MEWFQQPFQQHLDDYIAGKISEKQMLHLTEYFERWGYDYRLYRPVMQYAREHNIPIIALNASTELRKALSNSGISELPAELKKQLPESYDWSDKDYEKRLRKVLEQHPNYKGTFESFLRGQLTWDESMAERTAEYLMQNPGSRMLVLAGAGHIEFGSGIPNRIKRRIDVKLVSIMVAEGMLGISSDMADYLVISEARELEPVGLIGAYLNNTSEKVIISGFSKNSAIRDAGLKEGAVIVGVDDEMIRSNADFRLAMLNKRAGDTIQLHYRNNERDDSGQAQTVEIRLR